MTDLFGEILEKKYTYDKIVDSVELTQWIVTNDPDHFSGLKDEFKDKLNRKFFQ